MIKKFFLSISRCKFHANFLSRPVVMLINIGKDPLHLHSLGVRLVEYVVFDIVLKDVEENGYRLADVEVARAKDFGNNGFTVRMKTHLGHVLKSGDYVLGYDLFENSFLSDFSYTFPPNSELSESLSFENKIHQCLYYE
ncbi:60S ribosomal export protein NMD3 [Trifolium repens]|nr:60S ribosomal export protein NMD3 [Trifolium repens]